MNKFFITIASLCFGSSISAQVVPPVNVWTPGGGNIYFNGGNVGVGLTTPLYPLHVMGDAFISNSLNAKAAYVGSIRTDSVKTGVINASTGLGDKNLRIFGGTTISGSVSAVSYRATSFTGAGERYVYVDSSGTFRTTQPIGGGGNTFIKHCVTQAPWMIGGNVLGSIQNAVIGPCDQHDFVMQTNGISRMFILATNGNVGIGNDARKKHWM